MRRMAEIADLGMAFQIGLSKPGVSELEIESQGDLYMIREGVGRCPKLQIDAGSRPIAGERSALPHALTSGRPLAAGDTIIHGVGVQGDGYWAGVERTVFLGRPTAAQRDLFDLMIEARQACPGRKMSSAQGSTGQPE